MKRTLTLAISATLLTLAVAACQPTTTGSSSNGSTTSTSNDSSSTPPVPTQLRDLDQAAGVNPQPQAAYDKAFATLSSKCKEQGVGLGNEVGAVLKLLQKANINDETQLTVMQHLAASIPAGSPKMSCADIGGAYVTLRENK
jgi:hypothetical protein